MWLLVVSLLVPWPLHMQLASFEGKFVSVVPLELAVEQVSGHGVARVEAQKKRSRYYCGVA